MALRHNQPLRARFNCRVSTVDGVMQHALGDSWLQAMRRVSALPAGQSGASGPGPSLSLPFARVRDRERAKTTLGRYRAPYGSGSPWKLDVLFAACQRPHISKLRFAPRSRRRRPRSRPLPTIARWRDVSSLQPRTTRRSRCGRMSIVSRSAPALNGTAC